MCDCCGDLIDLLLRYDRDINEIVPADDDPDIHSLKPLTKSDLEVLSTFTQIWNQRRCHCIFKEGRNVERLNNLVKGLLLTCFRHLKHIYKGLISGNSVKVVLSPKKPVIKNGKTRKEFVDVDGSVDSRDGSDNDDEEEECDEDDDEEEDEEEEDDDRVSDELHVNRWMREDREKLLHLVSKVFSSHFPVYALPKHQNRLDDLIPKDAALLSSYCDLNDSEIPILLLKNITFFCELGVMDLFSNIFLKATPETLPLSLAHAIVAVIHHLKYGLNLNLLLSKLVSLRSVVINYLCQIPDRELRNPSTRSMFEFMWTVIKDPLETRNTIFDKEGLALALKYFTSTTLTMRLTGISQINNYITVLNEYSQGDGNLTQKHVETLQGDLSNWILNHKVIEHIFGPNLHVEVIKQSHIILNFVAPKINGSHVDSIWSAAQLKHCSKQVHDLLTQLVKNMNIKCVFHLYSLLRSLEPKEHNEQTLNLTSCILKFIWGRSLNLQEPSSPQKTFGHGLQKLAESPIFTILPSRSQDGESSSASADASDEDDEDFDVVISSEKMAVDRNQRSPESNSSWSSDGAENKAVITRVMKEKEGSSDSEDEGMESNASTSFENNKRHKSEDSKSTPSKVNMSGDEDDERMGVQGCVGSRSSENSETSEKRLSDFEGEDCNLDCIKTQDSSSSGKPSPVTQPLPSPSKSMDLQRINFGDQGSSPSEQPLLDAFSIENVCKPGQTLLWDLIQDDRSSMLPEGLSQECEKVLCNLIAWISDRRIKMKFVEGCLENLEKHRSVIVVLKLLPKLMMSFQSFRGGADIHQVTRWADTERRMMHHFFEDLNLYSSSSRTGKEHPTHHQQIQIRLSFLSFVFSVTGSHESFKLSREQVDTLWSCVAEDPECRDDLFGWMITQVRSSREYHALNSELLGYIMTNKMPHLRAEDFTMMALEFLNCLCYVSCNGGSNPTDIVLAIRQLWDIALMASNTDVSMAAIKHLNAYYIHSSFRSVEARAAKEQEFIKECMSYLKNSAEKLDQEQEKHSTIIQRALVLLKNHLEVFRTRYAYHLRRMQLAGNESVASHRMKVEERSNLQMIRVLCQTAFNNEKTHFEMPIHDHIGDLRAEVTHWWESPTQRFKNEAANFTSEGPLRLLSQGQELTYDFDEKTLADLGFKDMQMVYISIGAPRQLRRPRGITEPTASQPPPPRDGIPSLLLLDNNYLEQLFSLSQQLGSMSSPNHVREQVLSRRVWDIIQMLPTSKEILTSFKQINALTVSSATLNELLNTSSPQKLIYSIQIVEWLRKTFVSKESSWSQKFIESRGLSHLFNIFISGCLQQNESEVLWDEWKQDCLASLLHLIYSFGIESDVKENLTSSDGTPSKEITGNDFSRKKRNKKVNTEKMLIHRFNSKLLDMLNDTESLLKVLLRILDEATARPSDASYYQTGFWGRAQIVHHAITFLISWIFSDPNVSTSLFKSSDFTVLLKKLVLDDPDPSVRREACTGFYRMCLGYTADHLKGHAFIPQLLNSLLTFITFAQNMRSSKRKPNEDSAYLEKEPYGPGCKDYFYLVCRLIDSLDPSDREAVDFDHLTQYVSKAIVSREIRESRPCPVEDEGLRGLIALMTAALKQNPRFKFSDSAQKFLSQIFDCMFALPNQLVRDHPKCKLPSTRSAAFDLLVELSKGAEDNHLVLIAALQEQHKPSAHSPYPWDFWPHDDCRSECGYVGLINLGATCYMASCLQHLFMIPETRNAILTAKVTKETRHEAILTELQKLFAFLAESERKSYNPRSFCKVYTMDHEFLNTGEQKDMTEFFTDLISKFEEMTDDLKGMVKTLFGGTLSNNVVSLDCPHISRTSEEFYTLRCKVADMRNLWDSLDELTVKDTLEGDNMYTCSQCGKKVRAEKRACLKKLPRILCFNTMRYTFNMITMTKEKVNTHFSFPLILDMNPYLEHNLIPEPGQKPAERDENHRYELIGVTVHTGTAEGGHYYSFIRERESVKDRDKWYMFNDAEVKYFDPSQLGAECFGGEMTSKTYDSVTDKFMDFSFEKTNSAYMLFYEKLEQKVSPGKSTSTQEMVVEPKPPVELPSSLASWIWDDNVNFLRDKTIFEHSYFEFMWQVCSYVPQSFNVQPVNLAVTKLATSFLLETLIHSKEKPTLTNWIELLTKQFNANKAAGEWLLEHMSDDPHWAVQILLKSPNQMVRQLFQRLCIHVINQLRSDEKERYLNPLNEGKKEGDMDALKQVGQFSSITRFVKKILTLIKFNNAIKPHPKHLTEYFTFLYEFAKMGEEEARFLLVIEAISTVVQFYTNHCKGGSDYVDMMSEDEDDGDDEPVAFPVYRGSQLPHLSMDEKSSKPASLEKMVAFVAYLVEKSRGGPDNRLRLNTNDYDVLFNGKGLPFIQRQIRDNINLRQTLALILSFCRYNDSAANMVVNMMINAINRQPDSSSPFFRLLSMLVDQSDVTGLPNFGPLIYPRIWEFAEHTPQHSLEWLTVQVTRNKAANAMVLSSLDNWVEYFILNHSNQRVRNAAAVLLISLVPNNAFRQSYNKSPRIALLHQRDTLDLNPESISVIQRIFSSLLTLLKSAKDQADSSAHGTTKLVSYFTVMSYCLVTKTEKLMLTPYFMDLWNLFQPKLSEPAVPVNQNKQALLYFWYNACVDCPENVQCIVQNPAVVKNIAFNYILADHDDQDVILFNRSMLPSYYGLLKLCCSVSRPFTRQLAQHQNIQWAFKNITPFMSHYQMAVQELFKLMKLFVQKHPDSTEQELREIFVFKRNTLHMYLTQIDPRQSWAALVHALTILVETDDDKCYVVVNGGVVSLHHAFASLFMMFHEATACHVTNEIVDVLKLLTDLLLTIETTSSTEVKEWASKWKDHHEVIRRLVHLLNTYTPSQVRLASIGVLQQLIRIYPKECVPVLVQSLGLGHLAFQDQFINFSAGPYYPRRGQRILTTKSSLRPPKAVFQMHFHPKMLETKFGVDEDYDKDVIEYYTPYYQFVVAICKTAIHYELVNQELVGLCSMVAVESLPLKLNIFPRFWIELCNSDSEGGLEFINLLCSSCNNFRDFLLLILTEEFDLLNDDCVFQLFDQLASRVSGLTMTPQILTNARNFRLHVDTLVEKGDDIPHPIIFRNLRFIFLVLKLEPSFGSEPHLKETCNKLTTLSISDDDDGKSTPDSATPQKKRRTSESVVETEESPDEAMAIEPEPVPSGSQEKKTIDQEIRELTTRTLHLLDPPSETETPKDGEL